MRAIAAVVLLTSASASADPVYVCKAADGSKALQDQPCDTALSHKMGVTIVPAARPRPQPPACSIYTYDWHFADAQRAATISNRVGAVWSERMRADEAYLRQYGCLAPDRQ